MSAQASLWELARLLLGATAFGGPAAHIAMMDDEVVKRRRWLTCQEFLDLLGATNFIPGPNSTEMAIHIGHRQAGWPGLIVAGVCFIIPAVIMVTAIAAGYVAYGKLPQVGGILYGVKPVIIAVVVQALWGLGRSALKSKALGIVALVAALASLLGLNEVLVVFLGGALALSIAIVHKRDVTDREATTALLIAGIPGVASKSDLAAAASSAVPLSLSGLFYFFAKVGSVLFGSGYVLLAFLRSDLVERLGWLFRGAAPRRHGCGTVHSWTGFYYGYLYRIHPLRSPGSASGDCGNLSAGLCVCSA